MSFSEFYEQYNLVVIFFSFGLFALIVYLIAYISAEMENRKAQLFLQNELEKMGAGILPAGQELHDYFGSGPYNLFPDGYYKFVSKRYGPFSVRHAKGEYCAVECRQYGDYTRKTNRYVVENVVQNIYRVSAPNKHNNKIQYFDYYTLSFRMDSKELPEFNIQAATIADLFRMGGAKGPLAKYFTPKAIAILAKELPGTSVYSSGDFLLFYLENQFEYRSLKGYAERELYFIKKAKAAAEEMLA